MTITLNVFTQQEAFTAVKAHLEQMTHRSIFHDGAGNTACRYRADLTPTGNRCAIGALIPDNQYDPEIDTRARGGVNVGTLIREGDIETNIHIGFLSELQQVHDANACWDNVGDGTVRLSDIGHIELIKIATSYSLVNE